MHVRNALAGTHHNGASNCMMEWEPPNRWLIPCILYMFVCTATQAAACRAFVNTVEHAASCGLHVSSLLSSPLCFSWAAALFLKPAMQ